MDRLEVMPVNADHIADRDSLRPSATAGSQKSLAELG